MLRKLEDFELGLVAGGNEIVVTATRDQVEAAHDAYQQAQIDVAILGALAIGYGTYATAGSAAASGVFAGGSFLAGMSYDELVEMRAEELYQADGSDGVWDGKNDNAWL